MTNATSCYFFLLFLLLVQRSSSIHLSFCASVLFPPHFLACIATYWAQRQRLVRHTILPILSNLRPASSAIAFRNLYRKPLARCRAYLVPEQRDTLFVLTWLYFLFLVSCLVWAVQEKESGQEQWLASPASFIPLSS